jgi:perosamine synthetase
MLYLVAPAGTPISPLEIAKLALLRIYDRPSKINFKENLISMTGTSDCFFFNSGRTALYFILNSLARLAEPGKREVIMPGFTCPSVALAIAKAGLKIRLVDIVPETMDYNYSDLGDTDFGQVLAILSSNLFGLISDWQKLGPIAREKGIFAIEDAAQTLGNEIYGRPSGSFGDAAFFSFGRGKNLSTYSGGAAVTANETIAAQLRQDIGNIKKGGAKSEIKCFAKLALSAIFLPPRLYWFPNILPFLKLGKGGGDGGNGGAGFNPDFGIGPYTKIQECAGSVLFPKLKDINLIRRTNAGKIAEGIALIDGLYIPRYNSADCVPYLRLPVLMRDISSRDKATMELRKFHVMAGPMYSSTIRQLGGIEKYLASPEKNFPGSEAVSDRLICLPTHPYLKDRDIEKIINVISKI